MGIYLDAKTCLMLRGARKDKKGQDKKGLSLKEVAIQIGVSDSQLSRIERRIAKCSRGLLKKLADVLELYDLDVDSIFDAINCSDAETQGEEEQRRAVFASATYSSPLPRALPNDRDIRILVSILEELRKEIEQISQRLKKIEGYLAE
jgi:transcriptional regulator with XRE-family HTH domain